MNTTTVREQLYEVIQASAVRDDDLQSAVLTGFMVVAEWQSPDGDRWISKVSGDHAQTLPAWRERGFAAEVLHDWWAGNDDERSAEDDDS